MAGKKPNPVDTHVGSRVRLRRMLLGMRQERLGESMGLTFQQVQKYEKGVNRIGASRLFQISKILDVPIQFFFEEAPHIGDRSSARAGMAEPDSEAFILEFLNSREGLELNRAFVKIGDAKVRKLIIGRQSWMGLTVTLSLHDFLQYLPAGAAFRIILCQWLAGKIYCFKHPAI